jgi:2',3'-cyclic-nucleotide 2'-phosphodiesterase/3'-nucleotidase
VNYEINISKEPGERIEHLTWPDGTSVKDTVRLHAGVNYYCANSCLLHYGDVFREGDELSVLVETDMRSDLGGTVGSEYSDPYVEGRITIHGLD